MINRGTSDRLEDAIDRFEENWSPESHSKIEELLSEYSLGNDDEAIVELIRIDIELRYERGLSIELHDYLQRFGILHNRPERVAEIAFEDYRSRTANGRSISPARWSELPGVSRERWFQELSRESSLRRPLALRKGKPNEWTSDVAFEAALQEAGFQLVQKIGEGAFSQVYLANQSDLADRYVVLKIVSETLAEPEYMALLQHTNIVPIYSFHQVLSRSAICMPYAGRVTLHDFLRSKADASQRVGESLVTTVKDRIESTQIAPVGSTETDAVPTSSAVIPAADDAAATSPLTVFQSMDCGDLAMWIFQRLAAALAHAHARGVLHNDLKPSNVLIRNDGEPALLDFNLSQSLSQQTMRRAGGTLPYMAPETLRAMMARESRPGVESDLYSLGVMLFEFITGRLPYPAPPSIAAVDLGPAIETRRSPPAWRPSDAVGPGLKAIVERCLKFDPEARYRSADALQLDLQHEQQSLALVHASEPATWKFRKWTRRHPRAIASGWVAALLLAILIPVTYLTITSMQANRDLRSVAAMEAFSDESSDYLAILMADPNSDRDENVKQGIDLLRRYGLLDRQGIHSLLAPHDGPQQQAVRDTLLRHLAHLAILESKHLSQMRISNPQAAKDFTRLDLLINATKVVDDGEPSRARLQLESERARLAGDKERHELLQKQADEIDAQSDAEMYLEAVRLLANYDQAGSRRLLSALADRNSIPSVLRWTMLGRAQYADRRVEDALLSFTQAIARAPNSSKLHVLKGRCHLELNQYDNAEEDYMQAIQLDPESISGWSQLGLLQHNNRKYQEALRCYDRALELSPGRIWVLLKRSQTYRRLGNAELADADYRAAMEASCEDSNELLYRALARAKSDPEIALQDLRRAHELNPDRPFLLQEMARILAVELRRHDEAIEVYGQMLAMQPANEFALVDRALSLVRQGQIAAALEDVRKAMRGANDGRNLYQAACVHALIGKEINKRRSITLLAKAIRQGYEPKDLGGDPDLKSIHEIDEFQIIHRFFETSQRDKRGKSKSDQDVETQFSLPPLSTR